MARDLVIGLDCGTSACKAIAWDKRGKAIAEGRAALKILEPESLWREEDADSWWEASVVAISRAARRAGKSRIAALCVSNQRESFVPVDESGKALHKAILWMDERAGPLLGELASVYESKGIDTEGFRAITGKTLSGNLSLSKIAWLAKRESDIFASAHKFLDTQGFLCHRLTGAFKTSWGSADPMGLFDMRKKEWSPEIASGIGLDIARLPEAFAPGAILGTIGAKAARACHLDEGIPLVSGLGDGQAAGLGCGVAEPGESYLSLGTSIVSGSFSKDLVTSPAFRSSFGGSRGSYFLETVILGGTYTIQWFVDRFLEGRKSESKLVELASDLAPGAEGLTLVPYWNSAMNPYWDSEAKGIVVGWTGIHGPAHFYRAILEGLAFEQRLHTLGVEKALGTKIERYVAMGGGAKNELLCRIIADVTGKPLFRAKAVEASSLGAGILAASAVGIHPNVEDAARAMTSRETDPVASDPGRHRLYSRLYEESYVTLYPRLG